jgi:hypothetical protein
MNESITKSEEVKKEETKSCQPNEYYIVTQLKAELESKPSVFNFNQN